MHANATIDLLMAKIIEEDRAGASNYTQSRWVSDLASLAAHVEGELRDAFYGYRATVQAAYRAGIIRPLGSHAKSG